jgi:hypothetical protein
MAMTVSVIWDDEAKTIQRYVYEGRWTWDELFKALDDGHRMLDEIDYKADSIVDMQRAGPMPPNALVNLKHVYKKGGSHPNYSGLTIFINAAQFIRAITMMVAEFYPEASKNIKFIYAQNLEEAYAIIHERRAQPR